MDPPILSLKAIAILKLHLDHQKFYSYEPKVQVIHDARSDTLYRDIT